MQRINIVFNACLCLALCSVARLSRASEGSGEEIFGRVVTGIEYAAAQPLDRAMYDRYLGVKPGDTLTRTAVKNAIQFLHDTGNFSSIILDAEQKGGGVRLLFRLEFHSSFDKFQMEGGVRLGGQSLSEALSLPVGERFTPEKLEAAQQAVLRYLKDRGYYQATVQASTRAGGTSGHIDTLFKVSLGSLASIRSLEVLGVPPGPMKAVTERLHYSQGMKYDRRRFRRRVARLQDHFRSLGYLAATVDLAETPHPEDNTVALAVNVTNFGKARVTIEGFKIDRERLHRLLPVLSGAGINPDLMQEGLTNLQDYLAEVGYPEAEVQFDELHDETGVLNLQYRIDAGRKVTVSYLRFEGNHAVSTHDLLVVVKLRPAAFLQKSVYSIEQLDSDVDSMKALYNSRGYPDTKIIPLIRPFESGAKLGITFEIEDGRLSQVRSITMTGNKAISGETLRSRMKLKVGGAFSVQLVEADRQALLAAYNDAGYLHAQVTYTTAKADESGGYGVAYSIQEDTQTFVDNVFIFGSEQTRPSFIQRRIKLSENQPLSLGKILETQQALYRMGVFDFVRVSQQIPDSRSPVQNVTVRLADAQRFTLRYGLGWQEHEGLRGTFAISDLNTLGTGRRADLWLRGSRLEQSAILEFRQPQIRILPLDSYLSISGSRQKEISFDQTRVTLSYQFSHPLSGHSWALFRYNFRNVRVYNLQVSISELGREDTPRNLSTFSAIYVNDSRDDYADPEKGFFTSTDLSVTTKLLGSNSYLSLFTQNSYYRKLSAGFNLASSLRFGVLKPYAGDTSVPISERFFAGGASTLRGFKVDEAGPLDPATGQPVGGNALLIGNLELRTPSWRSLRLAAFYDVGNVFQDFSHINPPGISHTVGIGLRLKTPLGPLRADYGFNLNLSDELRPLGYTSRHFFFTIGAPF